MESISYPFSLLSVTKNHSKPLIEEKLYKFKSVKSNKVYHVLLDFYEYDVVAVKFYCSIHENRKDRYNILTYDFDVYRILYSVINICLHEFHSNKQLSFCFVGVPVIENEVKTEREYNTKRYRIYSKLAEYYFGTETFIHEYSDDLSAYLLMNKKIDKNHEIKEMFFKEFPDLGRLYG